MKGHLWGESTKLNCKKEWYKKMLQAYQSLDFKQKELEPKILSKSKLSVENYSSYKISKIKDYYNLFKSEC